MLPVVVGLIIIVIIFQTQNSKFLSTGNLTNLLEQSGVFVLLAMAEVFVLLLGEIDLSIGFVAGVGATVTASSRQPRTTSTGALAILAGLAACAVIGLHPGPAHHPTRAALVRRDARRTAVLGRLPALPDPARQAGDRRQRPVTATCINDIVYGSLSPAAGWIVMMRAWRLRRPT